MALWLCDSVSLDHLIRSRKYSRWDRHTDLLAVLLLSQVIHQIAFNNLRPDNEQTRIVRLDNNPHPMDIGTAKDFDAGEIF
jgi:hypothetical protein